MAPRLALASALGAALVLLAVSPPTPTVAAAAAAPGLLVPAYFDPTGKTGTGLWDTLTQTAGAGKVNVTAIMNPDNGPGSSELGYYVSAMRSFRAAHGTLLGYVPTAEGKKSQKWVVQQAQRYVDWYDVDGIFLDEMPDTDARLSAYEGYAAGIRALKPGVVIVGNPGTAIPAAYLAVADVLMTFEDNAKSYLGGGYQAPSWGASQPPSRQAVIAYDAKESQLSTLVGESVGRRYGWMFFTSSNLPNPYANLGSSGFWQALVSATAGA